VFLAALAIVDDLGAVTVIAIFYSAQFAWAALAKASLTLLGLITLNLAKVRSLSAYIALGIALWIFIHESGIHATIAGVLVAFTIPTRSRINAAEFARDARVLLEQFERTETGDLLVLTSKGQQEAIGGLERACESVTPPLLQLEHLLHRFSAFVVMPLFALANAGVTLRGAGVDRVTLGVVVGLVIGKPLGILGGAASAVRFGLGVLPPGVTWKGLYGCAWLGGIGFTMSLFIAALAFEGTQLVEAAKIGILGGSIVAGVVGASLMRHGLRSRA
jgi:NhaA family Na+:H+ antiporter